MDEAFVVRKTADTSSGQLLVVSLCVNFGVALAFDQGRGATIM